MSNANDIMRGGLDEAVFYTDAGDVLRVDRLAQTEPLSDDVRYFKGADGKKHEESRERERLFQLVDASDIATLQRWRDAGKEIGVIGLGATALLWREPVPILLEEAGGRRGDFAGKRLRLYTGRLDAEVERSTDLLAGVAGEATTSGGGTRWRAALPLVGRLVRLEAQRTVRLYGAGGAVLATDPGQEARGSRYITLPDGTRSIEVEAPTGTPRPRLTLFSGDVPAPYATLTQYSPSIVNAI